MEKMVFYIKPFDESKLSELERAKKNRAYAMRRGWFEEVTRQKKIIEMLLKSSKQ